MREAILGYLIAHQGIVPEDIAAAIDNHFEGHDQEAAVDWVDLA